LDAKVNPPLNAKTIRIIPTIKASDLHLVKINLHNWNYDAASLKDPTKCKMITL